MIQNPILPGFHPDPSICRVGKDFYIVTSSFSYFPGVPIFHSRDLKNWEQLGYVLDRPEQLPCSYEMLSGGIFAPTIRYHDGTWYMITTNMSMGCVNFIVTADAPEGPWSAMHVIEGADGIDPSLFFNDDGRAYYTGTTRAGDEHGSYQAIWCSEIDLHEMKLVGERKILWRGALVDAGSPEGPHLYKKDGWYYLMIAEGGTEHFHAVTISRSKEVMGPYTGYEGNPILTHRHLGADYPICNVGHADLVELEDGSWYMVMLASRLMGGYHKILGRETFLTPVRWENGWPVVNPGVGKVEFTCPSPESLPEQPEAVGVLPISTDTDFTEGMLGMEWNEIGTPGKEFYRLTGRNLQMKLLKNEVVPWELDGLEADVFLRIPKFGRGGGKAGFLGRRQQHPDFDAEVKLAFAPESGESTGITVIQNDANQLRAELCLDADGKPAVQCVRTVTVIRDEKQYFEETVLGAVPVSELGAGGDADCVPLCLRVEGRQTCYTFLASTDGETYHPVVSADGSFLGSETCGGFIGAYIGIFAACDSEDREKWVDFLHFSYKGC